MIPPLVQAVRSSHRGRSHTTVTDAQRNARRHLLAAREHTAAGRPEEARREMALARRHVWKLPLTLT